MFTKLTDCQSKRYLKDVLKELKCRGTKSGDQKFYVWAQEA
jgi:hypothetical protein